MFNFTLHHDIILHPRCIVPWCWLTWLFHMGYDPVEGHLRAHVPRVVHRLPAGLQRKAHLRQLHYCSLVYFWSWGHNKSASITKTCSCWFNSSSGLSLNSQTDLWRLPLWDSLNKESRGASGLQRHLCWGMIYQGEKWVWLKQAELHSKAKFVTKSRAAAAPAQVGQRFSSLAFITTRNTFSMVITYRNVACLFSLAHSCAEKLNTYSPRSSWSYLKEEEDTAQSSITIAGSVFTVDSVLESFHSLRIIKDLQTFVQIASIISQDNILENLSCRHVINIHKQRYSSSNKSIVTQGIQMFSSTRGGSWAQLVFLSFKFSFYLSHKRII